LIRTPNDRKKTKKDPPPVIPPVDASFYDIREYFQGCYTKDTMNQKSTNGTYNALNKDLRQKLSALAEKIKLKVYEYGFLLK